MQAYGNASMGTVVGSVSGSDYDLARCLALYDLEGDLPARARELWTQLEPESLEIARQFAPLPRRPN